MLKNNNIRVISATEPIDETPEGQLMESIFEGFAAYYVAELAVKVNRGLKENALKCKYNGGRVPFGYQIDSEQRFQIDPISAPLVREIYVDYADGKSIQEIIISVHTRKTSGLVIKRLLKRIGLRTLYLMQQWNCLIIKI